MSEELTAALAAVQRAQRELDGLRRENARLRAEGRALRRRSAPGKCFRIVTRALEDGRVILHYRFAGLRPGRRWLNEAGVMSARRYGWAVALLRLARLEHVTPQSVEHLAQCVRRLEKTAARLIEADDLTALRARGNRNIGLGR